MVSLIHVTQQIQEMQAALEHYKTAVTLHWDGNTLLLTGRNEKEFPPRPEEGLPVRAIIRNDVLVVNRKRIQIRRVYLKFNFIRLYHPVRGGWVLDGDAPFCMICQFQFTFFSRRHHCRLCGNIVCAECSDAEVFVKDCPEVGRVRACSMCYHNQVLYCRTASSISTYY